MTSLRVAGELFTHKKTLYFCEVVLYLYHNNVQETANEYADRLEIEYTLEQVYICLNVSIVLVFLIKQRHSLYNSFVYGPQS